MLSKKILSTKFNDELIEKDKILLKKMIPILYFYDLLNKSPEIKSMIEAVLKESKDNIIFDIIKVIEDSTFNKKLKKDLIEKYLSDLIKIVCEFQFKFEKFNQFSQDEIQAELKLYQQVADTQLYIKVGPTNNNEFPLILDKQRINELTTTKSKIFKEDEYELNEDTQFTMKSTKYHQLLPNFLLTNTHYIVGTRKVNIYEYWMLKDIFGTQIYDQLSKYLVNPQTEITLCFNTGLNDLYSSDKKHTRVKQALDRNEKIFLHGTSLESAKKIIDMGMDDAVTINKVYGNGIYATKCLDTALTYSKSCKNSANDDFTVILFKARAKALSNITEKDFKAIKIVPEKGYYVINTTHVKIAPLGILRISNPGKRIK